MRRLAAAMAIGSLIACGGSNGPSAPTAAVTNADVAGSYTATITASSACAANLPAPARVLNYVANVTQHGSAVNVQLLAHVIWNNVTVNGTVSGKTINFSSFSFSENDTGGGIALVATGTSNVAADGSIAGTLNGTFGTPSGTTCNAANHQIQMVRR